MKLNFDKLVKQETINLRYNSLYDEFEVIIKILRDKNAVIKKLNLYYNDITLADGKFTHALANNNTLEVLHLGMCTVILPYLVPFVRSQALHTKRYA